MIGTVKLLLSEQLTLMQQSGLDQTLFFFFIAFTQYMCVRVCVCVKEVVY